MKIYEKLYLNPIKGNVIQTAVYITICLSSVYHLQMLSPREAATSAVPVVDPFWNELKKTFDSIERETLWKIQRNHGILVNLVNLIQSMYEGSSYRIVHGWQLTISLKSGPGRDRDAVCPFFFLSWLLIGWWENNKRGGGIQRTSWTQLENLDLDDLALLSYNQEQMQNKTSILNSLSKSVVLRIHFSKVLGIGTHFKRSGYCGGETAWKCWDILLS